MQPLEQVSNRVRGFSSVLVFLGSFTASTEKNKKKCGCGELLNGSQKSSPKGQQCLSRNTSPKSRHSVISCEVMELI